MLNLMISPVTLNASFTALEPAGAGTQILYSGELFDGTLGQYMNFKLWVVDSTSK
jgi:hypothetical protein